MKDVYNSLIENLKEKFAKISLLILDFDGTLTNNKVYVSQDGKEYIRADRGDGLGLEYLKKYTKVKIIILSREKNPVTMARAKKLGIPCIHGLKDKSSIFKEEIKNYEVKSEEVCFVGNDINDLKCIKDAGLGVGVADAHFLILKEADYITIKKGGEGAVREVCELIMYAKKVHPFI